MIFALDYDNTFDQDPDFWENFVEDACNNGHDTYIVTWRDDRYDRTPNLLHAETVAAVYYTRGVAKKFYLEHIAQLPPDRLPTVWIDDRPHTVSENSKMTEEELVEWRKTRQ